MKRGFDRGFRITGQDGIVLEVWEDPGRCCVRLSVMERENEIELSADAWHTLCDLRYQFTLSTPEADPEEAPEAPSGS